METRVSSATSEVVIGHDQPTILISSLISALLDVEAVSGIFARYGRD